MPIRNLQVLFSPVEFAELERLDLSGTTCVVFDVLRATSSMAVALRNGAKAIWPVAGIPEALAIRAKRAEVLLAGEREGVRITRALTGAVEFDLGNSPREFRAEIVAEKTIVMTTTNGTRALKAAAHAGKVLIASFLNLQATADRVLTEAPSDLLLVCAGTKEETAYEDVLCAGALCDLLSANQSENDCSDSALIARRLFDLEKHDLLAAVSRSRNGRRLLSLPELRDDVPYCVQQNLVNAVFEMDGTGQIVTAIGSR